MSVPLRPLPDHVDPLTAREGAAAFGCGEGAVLLWLRRGRFPGAFQTSTDNGRGHWRIPRAAVIEVGRQLGVWL